MPNDVEHKQIVCHVCGCEFFELDLSNDSNHLLVCESCELRIVREDFHHFKIFSRQAK